MELKQLEYVVAIADEKSLIKAAERLYISQPALSHFITNLEKDLGFPLFVRTRNHWTPTFIGGIYIDGARKILETRRETFRLISEYTDAGSGSIKLGVTSDRGSRVLYRAFNEFHMRFPNIKLEVHERRSTHLREMLLDGSLDLAMCVWGSHEKLDLSLLSTYSEPLLLITPRGYKIPSYQKEPHDLFRTVDIRSLEGVPLISQGPQTCISRITTRLFESCGMTPNVCMEVEMTASAIRYVTSDVGVAFVQKVYAKQYQQQADFYHTDPSEIINVSMGHRKGALVTQAERYLASLFEKYLPVV